MLLRRKALKTRISARSHRESRVTTASSRASALVRRCPKHLPSGERLSTTTRSDSAVTRDVSGITGTTLETAGPPESVFPRAWSANRRLGRTSASPSDGEVHVGWNASLRPDHAF